MMHDDINEKLKEIRIEDYIWIIYVGIIFLSWYANSIEREFFTKKDDNSKSKYRHIMILIFSILVIIYVYFFNSSYSSFKKINDSTPKETKDLITLSLIASLLILVSGCIFLYVAIKDEDLEVELAFN